MAVAGHRHRRPARLPDRLLHGPGGLAARPRLLVVAVLMPLWAGYLVKVYAWRLILQGNGFLELGPRAVRARRARVSSEITDSGSS